jgi:hypothetical protein
VSANIVCIEFYGHKIVDGKVRMSRDNLDENGRRQSEFEAAAGSEVMIDLSREVRKQAFGESQWTTS